MRCEGIGSQASVSPVVRFSILPNSASTRNAQVFQRSRGLLARGAGAEIPSADDDVARAHPGGKARIDRLQAVLRDLLDAELHVAPRREHVGGEIVAEYPGAAGVLR